MPETLCFCLIFFLAWFGDVSDNCLNLILISPSSMSRLLLYSVGAYLDLPPSVVDALLYLSSATCENDVFDHAPFDDDFSSMSFVPGEVFLFNILLPHTSWL